ncbi:MAG: GDP-mannose 4,6-dehydratase [Thermodesulfobacteriota bacterium]|nr:GDP-mannose 4,6-dehydratase [Thermodesulfobacteriota bacterium]
MKALIFGISGQDGSYLAQLLLKNRYEVIGVSRDAQSKLFEGLNYLGIRQDILIRSAALNDFRSVLQVIDDIRPDEIYNLSGQSSVGLSFELPIETIESITLGTINILEAIRFLKRPVKIYNACSSECFGDVGDSVADEQTSFRPKSPYALAKAAAYWATANYREAYSIFTCSGILFNHESPLRKSRFVTQKIVRAACRIAHGSDERLYLGNIDIVRDWGWAPEYVEAMYLMLQHKSPDDYIIATGKSYSLTEFVDSAFKYFNLDWRDYVKRKDTLLRPSEILNSRSNPKKAREILKWQAKSDMHTVVAMMIEQNLKTDFKNSDA